MSDNVFLDTNVLVYSYSNTEIIKQTVARQLISDQKSVISIQVLHELCNVVTRKFKLNFEIASILVKECCQNSSLHINTSDTVVLALKVAERYKFSFYDSLIIAAALESKCRILYSEDMHDGQVIEDRLSIKNPFK